jgi:choline/glycine/proline betaine transport protein
MMNNNFKTTILKPVFIPSVLFIIILVLFTMITPEIANETFSTVKNFVAAKFGWLYMLSVGIFTLFVLF